MIRLTTTAIYSCLCVYALFLIISLFLCLKPLFPWIFKNRGKYRIKTLAWGVVVFAGQGLCWLLIREADWKRVHAVILALTFINKYYAFVLRTKEMLVLIATSPKNIINHTVKCIRKQIKLREIKQKIKYSAYRTNFYAKFKPRISTNFFTQLICFSIKHSVPSRHCPKHKNNFKFSSNFIRHEYRYSRISVCP